MLHGVTQSPDSLSREGVFADRGSDLSPLPGLAPARMGNWVRSYLLMLRFDFANQRQWLPLALALQVLMGAGMTVIYGFYVPHLPPRSLAYLVTGAPALALIPLGIVMVPALIGQQRTAGTFDFIWSLPVARPVAVASTLTVITVVALPGTCATLLLAAWRYSIPLSVSAAIVPAVLLTSLMAASIGMGLGYAIRSPLITNLITNILVFVVLLFSPIAFPRSQFPDWLANVHEVLPFYHMGTVIRAGLTDGLVHDVGTSYAVLIAWTVVGWTATAWVIGRRH